MTNRVQPIGPSIKLCDCKDVHSAIIVQQMSPTNYTMPLPYTPPVWAGTNLWMDLTNTFNLH